MSHQKPEHQRRVLDADTTGWEAGPTSEATVVLNLLRRQRNLYQSLHRLACRQRGLITQNDSEALLALLSDRQQLTESILEVGREIASHRDAWPRMRQALPSADRAEADDLLAQVSTVIGQVAGLDEEAARMLSTRKAQVAEGIKTARNERAAVSAYAAAVSRPETIGRIDEQS